MKSLLIATWLEYLLLCLGMMPGFAWRETLELLWKNFKYMRDEWRTR